MAEVAALYRGDFLAGFSLRGCPAFDEWQVAETENLRSALAAALQLLAQARAVQGHFEDAIAVTQRWLALDPLHEPAHQQLMRLYAGAGQQSAALRQYDACVRLLEAELGVAPHVTTVQIFRATRADQLLSGGAHAVSAAGAVTTLPAKAEVPSVLLPSPESAEPRHLAALDRIARGQFVARELEWAQASGAWQRALAGAGQVLLVSGEPGIGKTRLVRQLARFAGAAGGRVLLGECAARGGLPYAPFAQIVREILDQPPAVPNLPAPVRAELLRLARARPGRVPRAPVPALADPAFEQQRLFESLTA
ncbi:MAG: BTAD domain-containing putative transcriptional regulator, partial [Anaerolineales bacterium]